MHNRMKKFKAHRGRMSRKQVRTINKGLKNFLKMQAKRTKAISNMIEKRANKVSDMIKKHTSLLIKKLSASTRKLNKH